jgi:hypothetical protein
MDWHRAPGGGVVGAALALAAATCAFAQSPVPDFSFLESSWCTAPHDDYRPGRFVVEIRQIRPIRLQADRQNDASRKLIAQLRSAMVDAQTGQVDFVGGWMEFEFRIVGPLTLNDPVVDVTLSITAERDRLVYAYGDSRAHAYSRCGPATVQLSEKARLPAQIRIEAPPARAAEPEPAPPGEQMQAQTAPETSAAQSTGESKAYSNLSYCLSLDKTQGGFLGLRNQCSRSVNYTYCLLNPTSQNGRFFVCRTVQGRQIGQGSGTVQAGETGYLGLPGNERGRVVWFACEPPGIPALTAANPPEGRCQ